ncbi:hypothetical protein ACIGNX_34270 [Actinosynnema sp. NPDC053489]|uniref:hypothetical protein n=1 Tax=Actinosynnema sp. NPDC053489 TaxID=3363916 RepID=UPI0037CA069C
MDAPRTAALLGPALLALVACGGGSDSGMTPTPATPATAPTTAPGSSPQRPATVLRGQVEPGAEAGCLLLSTDRGRFLLLGGDPRVLTAGAEVEVAGTVQAGQATTCQEGTPFSVTEARAVPATSR